MSVALSYRLTKQNGNTFSSVLRNLCRSLMSVILQCFYVMMSGMRLNNNVPEFC